MTDAPPLSGVTPHLVCKGAAAAIEFYKAAFDAAEHIRLAGKKGLLMHAALTINGGLVMLVDEFPGVASRKSPLSLGGTAVTLHLAVADARAAIAEAAAAGAIVTMQPQIMFWGDLYGMITDPFGHVWSIATPMGGPTTNEGLAVALEESGM